MAISSTGSATIAIKASLVSTGTGNAQGKAEFDFPKRLQWATGTGAGQLDRLFEGVETANATPTSIDLSGDATRKDAFGNALTVVKLKILYIENRETDPTKTLTVGGGSNAAIGAFPPIPGGGFMILGGLGAGGIASITNSTADILKCDPGANSVNFYWFVGGTSA